MQDMKSMIEDIVGIEKRNQVLFRSDGSCRTLVDKEFTRSECSAKQGNFDNSVLILLDN